MGQLSSKQPWSAGIERLDELNAEKAHTYRLQDALLSRVAAEKAAGLPAAPGSAQAQFAATANHLEQLRAEWRAVNAHLSGCRPCSSCGLL